MSRCTLIWRRFFSVSKIDTYYQTEELTYEDRILPVVGAVAGLVDMTCLRFGACVQQQITINNGSIKYQVSFAK